MTVNKDNLGRKILDLIQENEIKVHDNEDIQDINLNDIFPNPHQPRKSFKEKSLMELSDSIKEHGVIQPIIVKPFNQGFVLIAGERRVRAARMANLDTIPAIVREYNELYMAEIAVLENLQRENLTHLEEAIAYKEIINKLGLKHSQLAKKLGKSRSYVTNILRLLKLPEYVLELFNEKKLSMGHARVLSKFKDEEIINALTRSILKDNLNVRQTEKLAKTYLNSHKNQPTDASLDCLKKKLKTMFNHDVKIERKRSRLTIDFSTSEELDDYLDNNFNSNGK